MKRNVTLMVMFVALLALAVPAMAQPVVTLTISSGFNMNAWCSPAMYNNCQAQNKSLPTLYGGEWTGYSLNLASDGKNPASLCADTLSSDGFSFSYSGTYLSGIQGTPRNGVLNSTAYPGGVYNIASFLGNASMPADSIDSMSNAAVFGNNRNNGVWTVAQLTLPVTNQGYYSDINFVLTVANAEGLQIWAKYSDSTSGLLYNWPAVQGGAGPGIESPTGSLTGYNNIYRCSLDLYDGRVPPAFRADNFGPNLYEFSAPLTLNSAKLLKSIVLVNTLAAVWYNNYAPELAFFAASATTSAGLDTVTVQTSASGNITVATCSNGIPFLVNGYPVNTTVSITVVPIGGYTFANWVVTNATIADSSASNTTMLITGPVTLSASYTPATTTYTVTVVAPTGGAVTVSPVYVTNVYNPNSTPQITATPATGYYFVNWTSTMGGSVNTSTVSQANLPAMTDNVTVTASFGQEDTVTINQTTGGTVTVAGITASQYFLPSAQPTITASANAGYSFGSWNVTNGTPNGSGSQTTLQLNGASVTVAAVFVTASYTPATQVNGGSGGITLTPPSSTYSYGQVVGLSASTATPGFVFNHWVVTGASQLSNSTAATTSLTVYGNFTLTAVFYNTGATPINISSGFNMGAMVGPKDYNLCVAQNHKMSYLFGLEPQGYANALGNGWVFECDSSTAETGSSYSYGGAYYTGLQGLPENGVLTSNVDGRTYCIASVSGNALLSGDWTEAAVPTGSNNAKFNAAVLAQPWGYDATYPQTTTATVSQGYYTDINFVFAAGLGNGAAYMQIWAIYSDTSSTKLYDFGDPGSGYAGPSLTDSRTGVGDFKTLYTTTGCWSDYSGTIGGGVATPLSLFEFAAPRTLLSTKPLAKIKIVDTSGSTKPYHYRELAVFGATGTPATGTYTVTVNQTTGGTVAVSPSQAGYPNNALATVTATASPNYVFTGWTVTGGTISPSASQATLTVQGPVTLSANFAAAYTVTVNQTTGGTVSVSPSNAAYLYNDTATVTASANPGYGFVSWSATNGTVSPSTSQATLTVQLGNVTLSASFGAVNYTATEQGNLGGTVTLNPASSTYSYGQVVGITAANANPNFTFSYWTATGGTVSNSAAATTSLTVYSNFNLTAVFYNTGATPLNISSGFNMNAWCSPAMYNNCVAHSDNLPDLYIGETNGYSLDLSSNGQNPSSFCAVTTASDSAGNSSYNSYNGGYLTGKQGTPRNGVLTSTVDGRVYNIASIQGNATVPADSIDMKNAVVVGYVSAFGYGGAWNLTQVTLPVTAGYYSDINFVLTAGNYTNSCQIWAVYSDTTSTKLYDWGATNGPTVQASNPTSATFPGFNPVFISSMNLYDGAKYPYFRADGIGPTLYEFSTPLTLVSTKPLTGIVVKCNSANGSPELAIFGATASPATGTNTVTVNQTTGGSVSVSPSKAGYPNNAQATATVTTSPNYIFTGWTVTGGTLSGSTGTDTLTVNGNVTLSANFAAAYTVTVNQTTGGSVSVSPSNSAYLYNATATVTATASANYYFVGWSVTGGTIPGSTGTDTLTVQGNVTLAANFALKDTVTVNPTTGGTVTVTPSGPFVPNATATITASANPGYVFGSWSVAGGSIAPNSSTNPATLTVQGNVTLSANFTAINYSSTTLASGYGTAQLTSAGPYTYGQVVGLTAAASTGWSFNHWIVTGASQLTNPTSATTSLTVYNNFTLTAVFSSAAQPIDISSGFNMAAMVGPKMAQLTITDGQRIGGIFGDESKGFAINLGGGAGNSLICDSSSNEVGSSYGGTYFTGVQGLPENGVLTSNVDGRTYCMASVSGNALLPGDWTEAAVPTGSNNVKYNAAVIAQPWGYDVTYPQSATMNVTPGNYADINFVFTTGFDNGARYMQIWAIYSDTSSTKLYDFGDPATGTAGPVISDSRTGVGDFTTLYSAHVAWNNPTGPIGQARGDVAPLTLYEFTVPRLLDSSKTLTAIEILDPTGNTKVYHTRELAIFAASVSPAGTVEPEYTLTVNQTTGGTVTVSPNTATYSLGSTPTITAQASTGYAFIQWIVNYGSVSGNTGTDTLTVLGPVTLSASFAPTYVVTVNQTTGGTVTVTPSQAAYLYNATPTIAASANPGYAFSSWSVTGPSTLSNSAAVSTSLTVTGNGTLSAVFTPISYNVAGQASPTAGGTVSPVSTTGTIGQAIALGQTNNPGYAFTGWTVVGASLNSDSTAVIIGTANVTVTAHYTANSYTVTVTQPTGGTIGVSSPTASYNQVLTLSQTPANGYTFEGYSVASGGGTISGGNQLTVTSNVTVTGSYLQNTYTGNETGGTINLSSNGPYTYGQVVGVQASVADGFTLNHWSVTGPSTLSSSTATTTSLTVYGSFTLTADFTAIVSNLTGSANPVGAGTVTLAGQPTATGTIGQTIALSATPVGSYTFSYWTVLDDSGYNWASVALSNSTLATANLTIPDMGSVSDMNLTVIANFVMSKFTITVNPTTGGQVTVSPSTETYNLSDTPTITAAPNAGYKFAGWNVTGGTITPDLNTNPATLTVNGNVTLSANFTAETFNLAAETSNTWVYQNTPATTFDRHALTLTLNATDTWNNTTYTMTVTQDGANGVVTPTLTQTNSSTTVLVSPTGTAPVVWTVPAANTTTAYLVGGRVLNGLVKSAGNVALTGSCTVTVTVVGDVSGPANPATASVTVFVRKLGDVDGNGKIQIADENYITQRIATGQTPVGIDPAALDVDGNGKIQVADENVITGIIAGQTLP